MKMKNLSTSLKKSIAGIALGLALSVGAKQMVVSLQGETAVPQHTVGKVDHKGKTKKHGVNAFANLASSDLSITITDNKDRYQLNSTNTYTIVVRNNGSTTITGAQVTTSESWWVAPGDMSWTAVASAGSIVDATSGTGNLASTVTLLPEGTITYTFKVYVSPFMTGALSTTASVALPAGDTDTDTSNNSATDTNFPGINALNDAFSVTTVNAATGGIVGDVTANDILNDAPVIDSNVTISVLDNGGLAGVSIDANGNLYVPVGTAGGVYSITYQICENGAVPANCDTAVALVQVFPDFDKDGVSDPSDLDDDNDGILDVFEETCTGPFYFNETFGTGGRTSTLNTTYIYEPTPYDPVTQTGGSIGDGTYAIVNKVDATVAWWADCYWVKMDDHTPGDVDGRMGLYNGSYTPDEFYRASSITVPANTSLNLSFWVLNVDLADNCEHLNNRRKPKVRAIITDPSGNILASVVTGEVPKNEKWNNYLASFNTGANTKINFILVNDAEGGNGNDLAIDDIQIKPMCDNDNDGIPNLQDLDSDGDGCFDAVEGDENVQDFQLDGNGRINTNAAGVKNANNMATVDTDGVPVLVDAGGAADVGADQGQAGGSAYDATINACICYNPVNNAAPGIPSKHGITLLKRAGSQNGGWPMSRTSAHTVLESNSKGFVITRVPTSGLTAIASPVEGMMVYDTTAKCLKIYVVDNASPTNTGWKCFSAPTCP